MSFPRHTLALSLGILGAPFLTAEPVEPRPDQPPLQQKAVAEISDAVGEPCQAGESNPILIELQALRKSMESKPNDDKGEQTTNARRNYIPQLLAALDSSCAKGNYTSALEQLKSLSTYWPDSAAATAALKIQLEQEVEKQEIAEVASLEAFLKELGTALQNAKQAEDVDPWLVRLAERGGSSAQYSSAGYHKAWSAELKRLKSYLGPATQITTHWQDYLMGIELSNLEQSKQAMRSIVSAVATFPYIPRSTVLKLNAELSRPPGADGKPAKIVTREDYIKRLVSQEAVEEVQAEIYALPSSEKSRLKLTSLQNDLQKFNNARSYILKGSYSNGFSYARELQDRSYLKPLVNELITQGIYQAMGISREIQVPENADPEEIMKAYLSSLQKAGNWKGLWAALKSARDFLPSGARRSILDTEIKNLELFLAGISYEEQEKYNRAIVAYRQINGGLTTYTPASLAIQKMKDLQKKHPDAAEIATHMQSHSSSVSSSYLRSLSSKQKALIKQEVLSVLKSRKDQKERPSAEKD